MDSAKIVREVIADGSDLPKGAESIVGLSLYNEACALAVAGKPKEALKSLDDAFSQRFSNMQLLTTDEDLVTVRQPTEFAEHLAKCESTVKESAGNPAAK